MASATTNTSNATSTVTDTITNTANTTSTASREFKKITYKGWYETGAGGTAITYFNDADEHVMLKVFGPSQKEHDYCIQEMDDSDAVRACGIDTPLALYPVEVEGKYGIVYERVLDKVSYSRLIADDPEHLEDYVAAFAEEAKKLHAQTCTVDSLPNRARKTRAFVQTSPVFSENSRRVLTEIIDAIPDTKTCLHGDLQTGNLLRTGDKNVWIDLGAFGYGHPAYDLGCVFFFYGTVPGRFLARSWFHMNSKQLTAFWKAFARAYLDTTDVAELTEFSKRCLCYALLFGAYTIDVEDYTHGIYGHAAKICLNKIAKHADIESLHRHFK